MAKPDRPLKYRDSERGRGRARDFREPMRDDVVLHLASGKRFNEPRRDNARPQPPKQGVNGALRAANLRLLLDTAPVREAVALVAEVPLDRLEAMSRGALCPDETAFHIERALQLPGKWLDGLNQEVPARTLERLKHPDKAALHDDDFDDDMPVVLAAGVAASAPPAAVIPAEARTEAALAQPASHATSEQRSQAGKVEPSTSTKRAPGNVLVPESSGKPLPVEVSPTSARPAVQPLEAAMASAAVQTRSSAAASRSKSGPQSTSPVPSPELRTQNLSLLLQGKGAKSALARLIGISQPYMSTIANGGKVLDEAFCRNVAKTLGMPDDWFELPRTAQDIPAAARQRLEPLPRGKGASAKATAVSDTAQAQPAAAATSGDTAAGAVGAMAEADKPPAVATGIAETLVAATSASGKGTVLKAKHSSRQGLLQPESQQRNDSNGETAESASAPAAAPVQADLLSQMDPELQPATQATLPSRQTEVTAVSTTSLESAPVMASVLANAQQAVSPMNDLTAVRAQPLIIEGGLPPIAEAVIKILAMKARQGTFSEDKAFELLAAVRLL